MPKEYPAHIRYEAEELYVLDGLTLEQTAAETGVSVSQITRWSRAHNWRESRKEIRRAQAEIERDKVLLRRDLISKALSTKDPQAVYAAAAFEKVCTRKIEKAAEPPKNAEPVNISGPEEIGRLISEMLEIRLGNLLTQPGKNILREVNDIKKALELAQEMTAKYAAEPEDAPEAKGLSKSTVDEIKKRILGINGN